MPVNQEQVEKSKSLLGGGTVEMLRQVHEDALWIMENLGVGCKNPELLKIFEAFEDDGDAIVYEDRIYVTSGLVDRCVKTLPGVKDFFVPVNSFFTGGTAQSVYNDIAEKGGIPPSAGHVIRIAKAVEKNSAVAGMGTGVKLKNEVLQMNLMAKYCSKPLCLEASSEEALVAAKAIGSERKNIMVDFSLIRSPMEIDENFSDYFIKTVRTGLPVAISSSPLAGISAPYCYNGLLAMAHAEVLFGICAAQVINPGITCVHGGYPAIADPRNDYNPNYGLIGHNIVNILMAHMNLAIDIPTLQSAGTTHEEHVTDQAIADVRTGLALCLKYGVHMIRHPFGFLRYFSDFSFAKLEAAMQIAGEIRPGDAPDVEMPVYDERGMEAIRRTGLGMYSEDPLTTANIGKVFVK
ncbi:trimethylamine methyltransferase family protein [Desulfococcaceae bacterium HSG8]|nr:trimethylamine methyltransferase family protein [Desulfococcaceae bacterium HSG8]